MGVDGGGRGVNSSIPSIPPPSCLCLCLCLGLSTHTPTSCTPKMRAALPIFSSETLFCSNYSTTNDLLNRNVSLIHLCHRPAFSFSCEAKRLGNVHDVTCAAAGRERIGSTVSDGLQMKDYYEVLGVPVDATYADIRKAYRQLQKKHHPDVAGAKGHSMTLLLNEAYETLMREDLRNGYNTLNSRKAAENGSTSSSFTGLAYSIWNGPDRPQGVFVDENTCIGCRECVFSASKTFTMDESTGCAYVKTQWGDSEAQIKVAIESCPVNCIHFVDREDLPIFEYLMRPQLKPGYGVCAGGWERPSNVFMAARTFKRKLKEGSSANTQDSKWREETPTQRQARREADLKIRAGAFWWLWSWGARGESQRSGYNKQPCDSGDTGAWPWKGLFGRSCTSELLNMPVDAAQVPKVVGLVREWAVTFASSSELPLPMPFRTDFISNGVQLSLITTRNGVIECVGSLLVTVEHNPVTEGSALLSDLNVGARDEEEDVEEEWWLRIKRHGTTGTKALPGEGRIVKNLKDAIKECDAAYAMYNLPRE